MNKLITALATPYIDGKIDKLSYEKLIAFQLEQSVDALLAVGTTAEAQLLDDCEKKLLINIAKAMAGDVPVYVGIEGRSTHDAVQEAENAQKLGADGILVAPPSFCKCTSEGYRLHVEEILKCVSVPLILYNAPSRCGYQLNAEVVKSLSDRVHFVKDAGSDLDYTANIAQSSSVLCGNDGMLTQFLEKGAIGVISVVSNVAPRLTRDVLEGGDDCLFNKLANLTMREVSPIPIKYMLYKKGVFRSYEVRLPLTAARESTKNAIDEIWNKNID
ncbi:MAG: dihydrodipicolinate synthase family protein [Clostridiales bacterium]|nr:dihydrodipicolinate synthase family protein [Clostridiales bacterium]